MRIRFPCFGAGALRPLLWGVGPLDAWGAVCCVRLVRIFVPVKCVASPAVCFAQLLLSGILPAAIGAGARKPSVRRVDGPAVRWECPFLQKRHFIALLWYTIAQAL